MNPTQSNQVRNIEGLPSIQPRSTYQQSMVADSLGGSSSPRRERGNSNPSSYINSPTLSGLPTIIGFPGLTGEIPPRSTYQASMVRGSLGGGSNRLQPFSQEVGNNISPLREQVETPNQLVQQSYETLVRQMYGLPVELPTSLIVNDLRLEFIPFSQLSTIQIERYIIEPLLQPWAGPPNTQNRIITIFDRNGMTHLVKAKYDQASGQIFPPV